MSISPTRNRLERRRERKYLVLGALEVLTALAWAKIADLDIAEGKKLLGAAAIAAAASSFAVGVKYIKDAK